MSNIFLYTYFYVGCNNFLRTRNNFLLQHSVRLIQMSLMRIRNEVLVVLNDPKIANMKSWPCDN